MNNDIIKGYVVIALKNLGYKEEEIDKVLDELYYLFDTKCEEEVVEYYNNQFWR